ncbi:MAG: Crp/Fnr family transcriptional regulator [Planctomycetota bacterium]|jgi:CRP-like cAMP-binding protein
MQTVVEKVLFLKSVDLFGRIPGESLARVAQIATEVAFEKGDRILKEGDIGNRLYLILEGEVEVIAGKQEVARLGKKEFFGEMALLDSAPISASVIAVTDVELLEIQQENFYELVYERMEISQGVISGLVHRLREADTQLMEMGKGPRSLSVIM